MTEIAAIFLVPSAEHRESLVGDGVCGSRAPVVVSGDSCAYDYHRRWKPREDAHPDCYMCQHPAEALVLVQNNKPVPDGIFRAWLAWGPDDDPEFTATGWTTYDVLAEALDSVRGAAWLAHAVLRCWATRAAQVVPCPDGDACPDAAWCLLLDENGVSIQPATEDRA